MARTKALAWMMSAALAPIGACAVDGADTDPSSEVQAQEVVGGGRTSLGGEPVATPAPTRSGGVSKTPPAVLDPDLKCYKFNAYGKVEDKSEKYAVPTKPDYYVAFNIKAPWQGKQYIKSFRSLIDNSKVLHHWLLYRQLNGGNESIMENVSGAHPDGEMVYGWAPGAEDAYFDPDVAMEVNEGSVFQLEMHYNNTGTAASPDASGVEVCVTPNKPEHVAGLSWVGEDRINGTTATGNCTPETKEPIHLILSIPHMHVKGTHMKVDHTTAAGAVRSIHDQPFDFDYQRSYLYDDVVIQPGDKLTTTCTYSSPARFGKGTNDEMCYFFAIHWPTGTLARKNLFTSLHGPNTCIDL
ncbi:MAG: hypothetical protein ABW252_18190 [Polyangiales bacterium]